MALNPADLAGSLGIANGDGDEVRIVHIFKIKKTSIDPWNITETSIKSVLSINFPLMPVDGPDDPKR